MKSYDEAKSTEPDDPDAPRAEDQRGPQVCFWCGCDCEDGDYSQLHQRWECWPCWGKCMEPLFKAARKTG